MWDLQCVLQMIFPGIDPRERIKRCRGMWNDIEKIHTLLWPREPPPKVVSNEIELQAKYRLGLQTSGVFAVLVWACMTSKRPAHSRLLGENSLATFIERAAATGFPAQFPLFEQNGRLSGRVWRQINSSLVLDCWTDSMSQAMANAWDAAVLDPQQTRPSTPRSATSVVDFVIFALRPVPIRTQMGQFGRERKKLLEITALSILTHVALALEVGILPELIRVTRLPVNHGIESGDEELRHVSKRLRLSPELANLIAERAAQLLFSGKDTWILFRKAV